MTTTINNNNIISGDLFIIPNQARTADGLLPSTKECALKWGAVNAHTNTCVEIWATDNDCSNWSDHYKFRTKENDIRFPTHVDVALFKGKKEGDKITLTHESGIIVELTLNQKNYRYRRFGTFEETLEMVV